MKTASRSLTSCSIPQNKEIPALFQSEQCGYFCILDYGATVAVVSAAVVVVVVAAVVVVTAGFVTV